MFKQKQFFQVLSEKIDKNLSLPYELSLLLNISVDSAYRRINEKSLLSANELLQIVSHFNIDTSLVFSNFDQNIVNFKYFPLTAATNTTNRSTSYLHSMQSDMLQIKNSNSPIFIYCAKEIPIFYLFGHPSILKVRNYYWAKSFQENKERFEDFKFDNSSFSLLKKIANTYFSTKSVEIWNTYSLDPMLHKIIMLKQYGYLEASTALELLDTLELITEDVNKILDNASSVKKVYLYESILDNDIVLGASDNSLVTYFRIQLVNAIRTNNNSFCKEMLDYLNDIIDSSTCISGSSKLQRMNFIDTLKKRINQTRSNL